MGSTARFRGLVTLYTRRSKMLLPRGLVVLVVLASPWSGFDTPVPEIGVEESAVAEPGDVPSVPHVATSSIPLPGEVVVGEVCLDLDCHEDACPSNRHRVPGQMPIGEMGAGQGDGTHSECEPDICLYSHGMCVTFSPDNEPELTLKEVQALALNIFSKVEESLQADAQIGMPLVERLMTLLPKNVVYEHSRQALQLIDCQGRAVAHYPLRADQVRQFNQTLTPNLSAAVD